MYSINFLCLSLVFITYTHCHLTLNTTKVGGSLFLYLSIGEHFSFFRINQNLNFTYINNYNSNASNKEEVYIEEVKEEGEPLVDMIKAREFNLNGFLFYKVPTTAKHYLPGNQIGFGFNVINENYSMIHRLKNQSLISKNEYTLIPGSSVFDGKMIMGELSDEEINKYSFTSTGKVNSSQWGCHLDSVYY